MGACAMRVKPQAAVLLRSLLRCGLADNRSIRRAYELRLPEARGWRYLLRHCPPPQRDFYTCVGRVTGVESRDFKSRTAIFLIVLLHIVPLPQNMLDMLPSRV